MEDGPRREFTERVSDLLEEEFLAGRAEELMIKGWTATTLEEALTRLDRESGWVQARAIRRALASGGIVTRAEVYEIGSYDADRMLRGFTRPANRIVKRMRASGEIPATAVDLLATVYHHGVMADEFRVPAELATPAGLIPYLLVETTNVSHSPGDVRGVRPLVDRRYSEVARGAGATSCEGS